MVNRFSYPPVTLVDDEVRNQMIGKELQMALVRLMFFITILSS